MSPRLSLRLLAGQSDQRLVALVREGHERAFEALVHRYRKPLLRYCTRTMGMPEARAEDAVQHALLKAWQALAAGTEVRELKPWLYRIVHNSAINVMRAPAALPLEPLESLPAHAAAARDSELEQRAALREALSSVAALPENQRDAVVLSAVAGHSNREVAAALGVTSGSVRGLLYRARETLRAAASTVLPPSVLSWLSRGPAAAPGSERLAEVSGAGTAVGGAGVLAKGAALALTAGVLATGVAIQHAGLGSASRSGHGDRARARVLPDRAARASNLLASATPGSASTRIALTSAAGPGTAALHTRTGARSGAPFSQAHRRSDRGGDGGSRDVRPRIPPAQAPAVSGAPVTAPVSGEPYAASSPAGSPSSETSTPASTPPPGEPSTQPQGQWLSDGTTSDSSDGGTGESDDGASSGTKDAPTAPTDGS